MVIAKPIASDVQEDPWANWIKSHGAAAQSSSAALTAPSSTRAREGPIKQCFQKQDEQIAELRESVRELNCRLEESDKSNEAFKADIKNQIAEVRQDVKTQTEAMSMQFEQTLEKAMQRQDTQFERSFAELRSNMLNKPLPAKKAKIQPPNGEGKAKDDMEDDES